MRHCLQKVAFQTSGGSGNSKKPARRDCSCAQVSVQRADASLGAPDWIAPVGGTSFNPQVWTPPIEGHS